MSRPRYFDEYETLRNSNNNLNEFSLKTVDHTIVEIISTPSLKMTKKYTFVDGVKVLSDILFDYNN